MNILVLAAIFPPHVIGGAELSAFNMCRLLSSRGHKVSVLTAAEVNEPEVWGEENPAGFTVYRLHFPRAYTMFGHREAKKWQKPLWHLKDYFSPVSRKIVARVMDAVKPDHVNVHIISGIGFGALREVAKREVSVTWFLHDLNLACIKSTTIHPGREGCPPYGICALTRALKMKAVGKIAKIGFSSPSKANLDRVMANVPLVRERPATVIRNVPEIYPKLPAYKPAKTVKLLYAGQVHANKGVALLMEVLSGLADKHDFHLMVLGTGPDEEALKQKYGKAGWVTFRGFVKNDQVLAATNQSDLVCVPSMWPENYSRTILQALTLGVPVLGSDIGGIPEQVRDRVTGRLIAPGDVAAWREALNEALGDRKMVTGWRKNAAALAHEFDADKIGEAYEAFVDKVRKG